MRPAVMNVKNMLGHFANVAILLFGTVVFCAWVLAMALDDVEDKNHAGQDINEGFEDLSASVYSLFVASTTQDFPNQMLPTFIKWRVSFLFFGPFMVLTTMVFLKHCLK